MSTVFSYTYKISKWKVMTLYYINIQTDTVIFLYFQSPVKQPCKYKYTLILNCLPSTHYYLCYSGTI